MPTVTARDGAKLHVETHGDGPLVIVAFGLWATPEVLTGLRDELATDHRVLTYDLRGTGRSDRRGPYDLATDVADLAEIIAAHDPPATFVSAGAGSTLALHVLVEHPDLVTAVVSPSGSPVNRVVGRETSDSFAGSRSVFQLLNEQAQRDYRGFLHNIVASTNPQLDDAGVRERVARVLDYTPHEVMIARLRAWLSDDAVAISRAAGSRLTILLHEGDPWSGAGAVAATRELLPEATVLPVDKGPLSRPDITADIVRRVTGVAA
jgi:pimeloyl-ACP methyl ester carboxylesterase